MGRFRRETRADDNARTKRLLDGIETAYAVRTGNPAGGGPLTDFEEVVIEGAAPLHGTEYPPPGHNYPRR